MILESIQQQLYQAYYDALSEAMLVVNDADLSIEKATQLIDELNGKE